PLAGLGRLQGVVVVPGFSRGAPFDVERTAVERAIDCAVANLRPVEGERWLVALPCFGMGIGGNVPAGQAESAAVPAQAATAALDRHSDVAVDAAFLAYTPTTYAVFLEARRGQQRALGPPVAIPPALEQALRTGEAVLFVGAGVSRGAGLRDWGQLIDRLADELQITDEGGRRGLNKLDIAPWYDEEVGRDKLPQVLASEFEGGTARPTLGHYLLTALPVRFLLTTNYDDLLEQALGYQNRYHVRIVDNREVPQTGWREGTFVVHLHGHVSRPKEIVLTTQDYAEFFGKRPAMAALLKGLLLNHTFLFLGYGLGDPNFWQIYHEIAQILPNSRRSAFATYFDRGRVSDRL